MSEIVLKRPLSQKLQYIELLMFKIILQNTLNRPFEVERPYRVDPSLTSRSLIQAERLTPAEVKTRET